MITSPPAQLDRLMERQRPGHRPTAMAAGCFGGLPWAGLQLRLMTLISHQGHGLFAKVLLSDQKKKMDIGFSMPLRVWAQTILPAQKSWSIWMLLGSTMTQTQS